MNMSKLLSPLVLVPLALLSLVVVSALVRASEVALVKEVQQGTKVLSCRIDGYAKTVDPKKVTDYSDGTWFFTNGYSKTCTMNRSTSNNANPNGIFY